MAYITREDGEHFVIPSYRDVLTVKQKSRLKNEILLLSQSYGEYITLQKKGGNQYEVTFSPDPGYLLGESVWHHFKRPVDMIYCEVIPNTTEAILVIVKASSVYLDGTFPLDSIPEELIIFLTQKNNFEIFIYGDVPISQTPEEGKFSFDANSVKSFTVLDQPVFQNLSLIRAYQLQLVDTVLKAHGIGVFPMKELVGMIVALGLGWMLWTYLFTPKKEVAPKSEIAINPYHLYLAALNSPPPEAEIHRIAAILRWIWTIPGWTARSFEYSKGTMNINLISMGGTVQDILEWSKQHQMKLEIKSTGISLMTATNSSRRPPPKQIFPLNQVIAVFVDKLASVYPGNRLTLGGFTKKGIFMSVPISVKIERVSTILLELIGDQSRDLPFILQGMTATIDESNNLTGIINMDALGN